MFKLRKTSLVLVMAIFLSSTVVFGQNIVSNIDKSQLHKGIISINYLPKKGVTTKVQIVKGDIKYNYDLTLNNRFPLQLGNGVYAVSILENVEGNKFRLIEKEEITLNLTNSNDVFLQSIQIISWNENMDIIKKAKELTANAKTDKEKVLAIYNYIVSNISYDYNKANNVKSGYVPSIEDTVKSSQGICYDYAALSAAMLRSVGVPTKVVMGRKVDIPVYHAWNQVYLKETNEWIIIDTTYDATLAKSDLGGTMVKSAKEYTVEKQY